MTRHATPVTFLNRIRLPHTGVPHVLVYARPLHGGHVLPAYLFQSMFQAGTLRGTGGRAFTSATRAVVAIWIEVTAFYRA